MNKYVIALLLGFIILMLCSCIDDSLGVSNVRHSKEFSVSQVKNDKVLIGIMQHNQDDSFQKAMFKGAMSTAESLGYTVSSGISGDDPVVELELIRNFAKQGVTLLVLGSTTQAASEAGIELAHSLGMKVVTMDSINDESRADGQVGGDDIAAGYKTAKALAESIGGSGKIAISKFPDPIPPSNDRVAGFYEAFSEYPAIDVIAEESTEFNSMSAMEWASVIIEQHPDIKGFISIEDTSAIGIIRAVEEVKMEKEIKTATVVESLDIYEELDKGKVIEGVFAMNSYNYGAMAVFLLDRLDQEFPIPSIVKTTGVLVTRSNVDENRYYLEKIIEEKE